MYSDSDSDRTLLTCMILQWIFQIGIETPVEMNQPDQYSKNNRFQSGETSRLLGKYLDSQAFKEGSSFFEIGTGDGRYTVELLQSQLPKNVEKYVASDSSEEMVGFAKRMYSKEDYPVLDFLALDIQTENVPEELINNFDYVLSFNCFHWFTNARQAFDNIFRLLKPGGEILATFFDVNPLDDIFMNLSKHPRWGKYGHDKYVSNFFFDKNPEESWEKTFKESGFWNIEKFSETRTYTYYDDFEDFFQALNPVYVKIPDDEKNIYLKDYFEEIKSGKAFSISHNDKTSETGVTVKYKIMFFKATKPLV
nr:juvenile hormone acid O-methyltransferase-like isoform X2 [Leptinotarsa decemlineata]